jgi:leucyl-tRNA synthetase
MVLGTVLANEEVINGLSERGNHPVVRQPLRQWVLKITEYADRLESGLQDMQWPEGTLSAQKLWIGRSTGASIKFTSEAGNHEIEVFTTRPDTLQGVTYVVLAPENPLVKIFTTSDQAATVEAYVTIVSNKSDLERTSTGKEKGKTGIWTGSYAVHPFTGEKIPIWVADYVLAGYGTGAVMAVPAHDERDFAFAQIFNLPIKQVVSSTVDNDSIVDILPYIEKGYIINSGSELNGLSSDVATEAVIHKLISLNKGQSKVTYKLRDWVFSRQRYWGEPIPIYFPVRIDTPNGQGNPIDGSPHTILFDQPIPVPVNELPLRLPDMVDFHPGDDPQGCLARAKNWRYFQKAGQWYARETNTMPQVNLF